MSSSDKPPAPSRAVAEEPETDLKTARGLRRVKILRVVQSTFSALLSLAIAIFQGRVFATFQATKNQAGTWPPMPNVVPTILLFSVALAALVFDGAST